MKTFALLTLSLLMSVPAFAFDFPKDLPTFEALMVEKPRQFDPVGHVRLTHPDKIRLAL